MNPLVVSRREAAAALNVSVWALDRLIADGELPVVRLPSTKRPGEASRRVLIAVADIESFISKHREGTR